jgi:beta-glucosidase
MKGKETVQLYIEDVACSVTRPLKELKGFQRVELKPGQSKTVTFQLNKQHFSFWNPETKGWFAEKGKFILYLGSSVKDIRLKQEIELI